MKNLICILLCITPFFSDGQSVGQERFLAMAVKLHDTRDSVIESYKRVYDDVLRCPHQKNAVLDSTCFIMLSKKLIIVGGFLNEYAKLLKENETPVWIEGSPFYVRIELEPPHSSAVEAISEKYHKAAQDVLFCVMNRGVSDACSSVSVSVSDAVNSLAFTMGWVKK